LELLLKNPGNSVFKSVLDAALPVYAIGTALIFVFGSLLKTDERRSSVTLWDWSANPKRHKNPICREEPLASNTVCQRSNWNRLFWLKA